MVPEPEEADEAVVEETRLLFTEADEVERLILSLGAAGAADAAEAAEEVSKILDRYQEQPSVLDPKLEALVMPLLAVVRAIATGEGDAAVLRPACLVMYSVCKVRGYKTIVKFVPHEARDLEPLVALLASVPPDDHEAWQVAYSLMIWLSMVVMVPFDLSIIDSSIHGPGGDGAPVPLVKRIEQLACAHLSSPGPARDAAAVLLARLLTRPGLQPMLRDYITWGAQALDEARGMAGGASFGSVSFTMVGVYSSLAAIFKLGHREELMPQLAHLGPLIAAPSALLGDASVTRRKLGIKLLQRVALVFLPPRLAGWRYTRGARSLLHNMDGSAGELVGSDAASTGRPAPAAEDDETLVPEAVEGILEQLLSGLRDADTVVRWSAAKGVGRITGRLPVELADDVVETAIELLAPDEDASAWHGGCLALAELARRGLLLPARLPQVLPRVVAALHYDVPRGTTSVGTHVRDAACYVCWAFARAFDASVMAPHVAPLAQSLLVQVAFDREVNVRRAASAAFQENVGRQGNFPHGIDIVTVADYFSVGSRNNSYLGVATYLAGFEQYRTFLLKHLLHVKSRHWDESIRLLAARAAAKIAPLAPAWVCDVMLPELCKRTLSVDLKERHGSVHMAAEVLLSLCNACHGGSGAALPAELRKTIGAVAPAIEKARLYRGRGGEVMRGAVCRLLEVCALVRMPCGAKTAIRNLTSVDESLKHPTEHISLAAVAALRAITRAYFGAAGGAGAEAAGAVPGSESAEAVLLVGRYTGPLAKDPNAALRRGYALAIGALPAPQLGASLELAVEALVAASTPEPIAELRDPETRRNAVRALVEMSCTLGLRAYAAESGGYGLPIRLYLRVVGAVLSAFDDYQMDNRGDVGSWVREAAMAAVLPLLRLALPPAGDATAAGSLSPPQHAAADWIELRAALPGLFQRVVCALCQQVTEKIDRVRELAATTLADVLREPLPCVQSHGSLRRLFVHSAEPGCLAPADAADFLVPSACFPITVRLLSLPAYRRPALRGLSVSAGGMTESTLRGARAALSKHLAHAGVRELQLVGEDLLSLLDEHRTEARLSLPLLRMTEQLLEARVLEPLLTPPPGDVRSGAASAPFVGRLHQAMRSAVSPSTKDIAAIMASLTMQVLLLEHARGSLLTELLRAVILLLGHRFPKVRKAAADQLYVHLLTYGDPAPAGPAARDGELGAAGEGEIEGEIVAAGGPGRLDECMRLLTETGWLADLDEHARPARARMLELFGLPLPQLAAAAAARPHVQAQLEDDSYAALVGEMGY